MQIVNILFSAVKSVQKILTDDAFSVCIATALDFCIQVQNCVAAGSDKMIYIIRSCIVFSQEYAWVIMKSI